MAFFTEAGNDVGGTISFSPPPQLAIDCTINAAAVSASRGDINHINHVAGSITSDPDLSFLFSLNVGLLTITGTFTDTAPVSCLGASGQFTMTRPAAETATATEIENRRTIHWWILDGSGELPAGERAGKIVLER
jgi:hypothetical protein